MLKMSAYRGRPEVVGAPSKMMRFEPGILDSTRLLHVRCQPIEKASGRRCSRTLSAGIYPRLDEFAQLLLRSRNGSASGSRIPAPGDEVVLRKMFLQQG